MEEKKLVPKLRFPGFTEPWEQRKLSEITTCFDNLRVPVTASDRVSGKTPYYGANGIQDYVSGNTHSGEFVLIAEDGANDLNDYPVQYVNGEIWVNNHAHVIAGFKEKLDNKFLSYALKTVKMTTFIVGSGRSKLNLKALLEIPISMPNYNEQCFVGRFIDKIDTNITLHQRKLEHLKLKKKSLLQKLFPKEGEVYPELRFPGFTDPWEQRKLSEVVTINPKTELPDEFKYVDLESVVGTNLLGFQVIKKENAPSRAQRLASYGDVFYQTVRPYQRNNYLFENVDKDMVFSTGYAQLRSKLDSYFLLTLVQNDNFVKVVLDNCTGTSYPAINGSELGKITVQIPPNEAEADQIGKVFRGIDKSITLHQRKLEHLQLLKKALLQQLFV